MLAALAVLTLGAAAVACRVPQRYDVAEVVGGLANPWDLAFAPDGELVLTERAGDIGVYRNGRYSRFNRPTDVVAAGEGGMMGLALDPSFASNRRLYTCYMTANDVRVVRWEISADWTTLGDGTAIVTGIPRTSGRHSGCRTRFGPDGYLWITTGDAADSNNPQNLSSLGGKVLRVDTDGDAAADNPPSVDSRVYAYGFRNPQGISFRHSDGKAFLVEHGPDRDDEITVVTAGGNGGWAPGPGYDESVPMTNTSLGNVLLPLWQSGSPTIAPSGSTFVTDPDWGDRTGQLAVAVLKGAHLRMFNVTDGVLDPGGAVLTGYGRLRVAVEGPDGRLYILTDANPGRVLAVQPVL